MPKLNIPLTLILFFIAGAIVCFLSPPAAVGMAIAMVVINWGEIINSEE